MLKGCDMVIYHIGYKVEFVNRQCCHRLLSKITEFT